MAFDRWADELLKPYALHGWDQWRADTDDAFQAWITGCLGRRVATDDYDVHEMLRTLHATRNPDSEVMLPMPTLRSRQGDTQIRQAMFLPRFHSYSGETVRLAFDLVIATVAQRRFCLAFRWEPAELFADGGTNTHGYGHVQMCRVVGQKAIKVKTAPRGLPESYPAFPLGTSDAMELFLAMMISVHGLEGGAIKLLDEFELGQPGVRETYQNALAKFGEDVVRLPA